MTEIGETAGMFKGWKSEILALGQPPAVNPLLPLLPPLLPLPLL